MQLSDVFSTLSMLISLAAATISYRQYRYNVGLQTLVTSSKISPVIDEESINAHFFGEPILPIYQGTLVVNRGKLTLDSCGFYVRRKTSDGTDIIHALPGKFYPEHGILTLTAGEAIHAKPANAGVSEKYLLTRLLFGLSSKTRPVVYTAVLSYP